MKQTVKLNEAQLRQIVAESVKKVLNERRKPLYGPNDMVNLVENIM